MPCCEGTTYTAPLTVDANLFLYTFASTRILLASFMAINPRILPFQSRHAEQT